MSSTDYNKLTVANLRALLKDRGIPLTGLSRKAQIIDRLVEDDQEDNGASEAPEEKEISEPEGDDGDTPEPTEAPVERASPEQAKHSAQAADADDKPEPMETAEPSTQTVDFAIGAKTPPPAQIERPSVEKPLTDPASTSEEPTEAAADTASEHSAIDASRINSEEMDADTRKRKRRSPSPDMSLEDIKAKKPRPSEDAVPDVHLKEDDDVTMVEGPDALELQPKDQTEIAAPAVDASDEKVPVPANAKPDASGKKEKEARYKLIFKAAAPEDSMEKDSSKEKTDSGPVAPAKHEATPALYIRDLMRPLKVDSLRKHLMNIGTPPGAAPDPAIVQDLFLDSMKTHALVLFTNIAAASRVRANLHSQVWPPEGQRKKLFVDFIPEDKVVAWIREETDYMAEEKQTRLLGQSVPTKRFEVVYYVKSDGTTVAEFGVAGSKAPPNAPKGPRSDVLRNRRLSGAGPQHEFAPTVDPEVRRDLTQSFHTLDQFFESTTVKPKLYYLPVSSTIADRRADDLAEETSRDWAPGRLVRGRNAPLDMKLRYTFDADDRVVEAGRDFGPWADDSGPPGGGRGGRGGWRGGGGGFRSERGRGGGGGFGSGFRGGRSWRG